MILGFDCSLPLLLFFFICFFFFFCQLIFSIFRINLAKCLHIGVYDDAILSPSYFFMEPFHDCFLIIILTFTTQDFLPLFLLTFPSLGFAYNAQYLAN